MRRFTLRGGPGAASVEILRARVNMECAIRKGVTVRFSVSAGLYSLDQFYDDARTADI
jgi:hypothetical protein